MSGWVRTAPGEAYHRDGLPIPTLGDGGGVFPEFVFHSVSPRAGEHLVDRPYQLAIQMWKTAEPGWCLRHLEVELDGAPVDDWSVGSDGMLRVVLPSGLESGLHGLSVLVEACCGRPEDFLEPVALEGGHYASFEWFDGLPPIAAARGSRTEAFVSFADPVTLRMVGRMDRWLVRDPLSGMTLPSRVSWLERATPSDDIALTFSPALPQAPVDLVVRWRGQESAVRFTPR